MENENQAGAGRAQRKAVKRRAKEMAVTAGHDWTALSNADKRYLKKQARKEGKGEGQAPAESTATPTE